MDLFYVQGLPFFHTISHKIQFRTVAPVISCCKATLLRETTAVLKLYHSRGFCIPDIHAIMEFECIWNDVLPARLDVPAANDHGREVKRSIRTMKEHCRSTIHGLPFKHLPKLMVKELGFNSAKALNQFLAQNGISDTLSPLTIMTGCPNPDCNDLAQVQIWVIRAGFLGQSLNKHHYILEHRSDCFEPHWECTGQLFFHVTHNQSSPLLPSVDFGAHA